MTLIKKLFSKTKTTIESNISKDEVQNVVESFKAKTVDKLIISKGIVSLDLENDNVYFESRLANGKAELLKYRDKIRLNISSRVNPFLYVFPIAAFIFGMLFLVSKNVTVNGDSSPSYLAKIGFSSVLFFVAYVLMNIIKSIERELLVDFKNLLQISEED